MVLALVFQLHESLEELAGDLVLIIDVYSHTRHVDVAQFACDQVLHRIHVLLVVVGNTTRSGSSAHELTALALPGQFGQNVIAYRQMRQRLASTAAHSVVTTIGVERIAAPLPGIPLKLPPEKPPAIATCFFIRLN